MDVKQLKKLVQVCTNFTWLLKRRKGPAHQCYVIEGLMLRLDNVSATHGGGAPSGWLHCPSFAFSGMLSGKNPPHV